MPESFNPESFPCPEYIPADQFRIVKYGKPHDALFNPETGLIDIYSTVGEKEWEASISPSELQTNTNNRLSSSYTYPKLLNN